MKMHNNINNNGSLRREIKKYKIITKRKQMKKGDSAKIEKKRMMTILLFLSS